MLITGASGAIGRALVSAFSAANYQVVGLDIIATRDQADSMCVRADLNRVVADLAYREQVVQHIRTLVGPDGINALINNAAVQRLGDFASLDDAAWSDTLNVNVLAPAVLIREFIDDLYKNSGAVVNISSIHATLTKPNFTAYATSKAALNGLTRALAVECGGRFRINSVNPAAIDTPMLRAGFVDNPDGLRALTGHHPVGRIGTPNEVAALCVFLCSQQAAFINGAVWGIDGGIAGRLCDPV